MLLIVLLLLVLLVSAGGANNTTTTTTTTPPLLLHALPLLVLPRTINGPKPPQFLHAAVGTWAWLREGDPYPGYLLVLRSITCVIAVLGLCCCGSVGVVVVTSALVVLPT